MAELTKSNKFYGYSVAIGCAIIVFCTQGALTTFGVYFPYILETEHYSPTAVSLMATCCSTVAFLVNTFFYSIVKKIGARNTMLAGIFFCGLHYVIYGLSKSVLHLYIGGAFGGLAMGCATNAIVSLILTRWFVDKRDQVISYAMLPMAFGSAVFSFISGQFIELTTWRTAYFIVAGLLWVIAIPLCLIMVKESPAACGQLPLGATEAVVEQERKKEKGAVPEMKTVCFWLMWIGLFLLCLVNPGLSQNLSNVMRNVGIAGLAASNYTTIAKICGALGFLLLGSVIKKVGGRGATIIFGIAGVLAPLALFKSGSGFIWLALACVLFGITFPTYHLTASYVVMDSFGRERFARIYGILQGGAMWAGAFASLVVNGIYEAGGKTSYGPAMNSLAVISVVGMVLILIAMSLSPKAKKAKAE